MNTKKITTQLKNKNMSDNQLKPQAQGLSRSHTQEEENQNKEQSNTEIIQKEEIKGTPFNRITSEGITFIALGQYRISEKYEVKDIPEGEPIGWYILDKEKWDIILNVCILVSQIEKERTIEQAEKIFNNLSKTKAD